MTNQKSDEIRAARKARQKANAHLKTENRAINEAAQSRFDTNAKANPIEFAPPTKNVTIKSDYYGDARRMSARWQS